MPKRIVFCADGTWNTPASQTNVYRLYKALTTAPEQAPYYDEGVGNDDATPLENRLEGLVGEGLLQKVRDGYTKVASNYRPGDRIFLFGFSRGAFTVRSIAGMIALCGLPTANFDDAMVDIAFRAYRHKFERTALLTQLNARYAIADAKIDMIGAWDTVGALGIPAIWGGVDPLDGFLDTDLHPDVLHAYHALSIDERRAGFHPTLWTNPAPGQTLEQVWFAGTHGDVGGYNPPEANGTRLADAPLAWMLSKAAALGLTFAPLPFDPASARDPLHETWSHVWGPPRERTIDPQASISNTVALRCAADASYRPINLSFDPSGQLSTRYHQVDVAAATAPAAS